jgi:hypothetical protein
LSSLLSLSLWLCQPTIGLAQQHRYSCPAYGGGYLPVTWYPQYHAYIEADNIQGPTPCFNLSLGFKAKTYKGDGNADISNGWPIQSARTYQTYFFWGSFNNGVQNSPAYQSPLHQDVNQTRNYGHFSPANGATLTAQDEDGIGDDCFLWHQWGFASMSNMHGELNITGPTGESGNARFHGTASNPLEDPVARIAWDMRVTMNGSNPTDARVTSVNYNHTCFPSHIIKVQHTTVYYWGPRRADPTYVTGCLVFQLDKQIGEVHPNKKVPCD